MSKRYVVRLTGEKRVSLRRLISAGRAMARKILHAHVLLQADEGPDGPEWPDSQIRQALLVHANTVAGVRERFVEQGLEAALNRRKQDHPSRQPRLDGKAEAHLIALRCRPPPEGRSGRTLRLLADKLVALEIVDRISYRTVRRMLKKNVLKPHLRECRCIPPEHNAEFVAAMEDVLDVYCRPYDARYPVVCMDETSKQLVAEVRPPIPAAVGHAERQDVEYERRGVAEVFLFTEPLVGWRRTGVTEHRTRVDWAWQVRHLLEEDYCDSEKVVLVMDNLNTHSTVSLYEAFEPARAHRLAQRLEIHYTPKHRSWLNIAEIELSVLSGQCLNRRIDRIEQLRTECSAWDQQRNARQKGVDWRFTTADARIKLKRLYPQMQL